MQAVTFASGRQPACSGAHAKLVWDVLPTRPRCAKSLVRQEIGRQQINAPRAVDMEPIATAASTMAGEGMPVTYLATTVSAGLLLMAGIASTLSQSTSTLIAKEEAKEGSAPASAAASALLALCLRQHVQILSFATCAVIHLSLIHI